jgi:hypothetical protein
MNRKLYVGILSGGLCALAIGTIIETAMVDTRNKAIKVTILLFLVVFTCFYSPLFYSYVCLVRVTANLLGLD